MIQEAKPIHIANFLIEEQLHNETVERAVWQETMPGTPISESRIQERRRSLVSGLTRQCPHYVSFDAKGNITRALGYRADHKFEAYWEHIDLDAEENGRIRSEFFIGDSASAVEHEIEWMNKRFGTGKDLLRNPNSILELTDPKTGQISYTHLGRILGKVNDSPVVSFQYIITPLGTPYCIGVGKADKFPDVPEGVRMLVSPPRQMTDYLAGAFAA